MALLLPIWLRRERRLERHRCVIGGREAPGHEAGAPGITMDLKTVIDLLGKEHGPADEMTGAFLEDAVATFAGNPAGATNAIRQLQASDPSGFVLAAVRMLAAKTEKSPGLQYVAGLVFAGNLLLDPLVDEDALPIDAAISLARNLSMAEPVLDARLMRKVILQAHGNIASIPASAALRLLRLVSEISDCSRLSSYLIQLLRHPSAEVRSKAALLLGRANLNLTRVKSFLDSDDARLRANAIESLWGYRSSQVEELLREASKDSSGRASMNALMDLCRRKDCGACSHVCSLASSPESAKRAAAAWAMGEIGDPEFAHILEKLAEDPDSGVRAMAAKSRPRLRPPKHASSPAVKDGEEV